MAKLLKYESLGVDSLWDTLVYSEALLLVDPDAQDLAPDFSAIVERAVQVRQGQLLCWRGETIAQAKIHYQNYKLDRLTNRFHQIFVRVLEDAGVKDAPNHARLKSYFTEPLSRFIARGLETQLPKCKDWPSRLVNEPEKELQEFAPLFGVAIGAGQLALQEMAVAAGARKSHRMKDIVSLFDDVNNLRKITSNTLSTREVERKLGAGWAENFFRKDTTESQDPIEEKQRAILTMLSARKVAVNKEERAKILDTTDEATIDRWCALAGTVRAASELTAPTE
jgi:hypothetical protein